MEWWRKRETHFFTIPEEAIVEKDISPDFRGRVFFCGSSYPSECFNTETRMIEGQKVFVFGRRGLHLLCSPNP